MQMRDYNPGIYLIKMTDQNSKIIKLDKVIVNR